MQITGNDAPSSLGHYVWWFPGCPVKVYLALDVVRQLREQLRFADPEAFGEGLLLGRMSEGAIEVLDFRHAVGRIPETVAAMSADSDKLMLVGYYRTESGDSLRLNDGDLSLARTVFVQPHHVFLVIQPTGFGPPNATFFFHDGVGKMAEFSLMEFPFDASLLAGEEQDRLQRSQEAAARRSAALQPPGPPHRRSIPVRPLILTVAALLMLLAFGSKISINGPSIQEWWSRFRIARAGNPDARTPAPALSALVMGLRARRENMDVQILWNRESPVVVAATSGLLTIQDGNSNREVALDASQIHNSSIMYTPSSNQVSLQLSITTPFSTVSESVMLLLQKDDRTPQTSILPASKAPGARVPKPFTPPPMTAGSLAEPALGTMPSLSPPNGAPDQNSIPILIAYPALPPPAEQPAGAAPESKSVPYHAAQPIRRVVPQLLPAFIAMIPKPATIEVRVAIDKTGTVTQAEVVPHPGINKLVLEQVATAARSWTFTPARRGDQPLPSELLLRFYFAR